MIGRRTTSAISRFGQAMHLPAGEIRALDALTTTLRIPAGSVIIKQGAFGNEALLLIEGELLVDRDGEPVAVLSPGAIVGEQAVLLNEPRNATVTAATDVVVAAMNRREFSTVLEQCPALGRDILGTAVRRAGSSVR